MLAGGVLKWTKRLLVGRPLRSERLGETLLIVTSDHETAYLTGPGSGATPDGPVWNPVVDNGIGVLPGFVFNQSEHTNALVPLYAKGDAARQLRRMAEGMDPVRGPYIDNTSVFQVLMRALGD